jgi:hypothetical protein
VLVLPRLYAVCVLVTYLVYLRRARSVTHSVRSRLTYARVQWAGIGRRGTGAQPNAAFRRMRSQHCAHGGCFQTLQESGEECVVDPQTNSGPCGPTGERGNCVTGQ